MYNTSGKDYLEFLKEEAAAMKAAEFAAKYLCDVRQGVASPRYPLPVDAIYHLNHMFVWSEGGAFIECKRV